MYDDSLSVISANLSNNFSRENEVDHIMDKDTLRNNLLANYGKYGVTRAELEPIIDEHTEL